MCEEYRRAVDTLFELGSDTLIPNGRSEHAAILLGTIFKYAKKYVYIFCQDLRSSVFDDAFLLDQINRAYERNVSIRILIGGDTVDSNGMRSILRDKSSISIRRFTGVLTPPSHYTVSDGRSFRMESNHAETSAIGCANRPAVATRLESLFLEMEKQSSELLVAGE